MIDRAEDMAVGIEVKIVLRLRRLPGGGSGEGPWRVIPVSLQVVRGWRAQEQNVGRGCQTQFVFHAMERHLKVRLQ